MILNAQPDPTHSPVRLVSVFGFVPVSDGPQGEKELGFLICWKGDVLINCSDSRSCSLALDDSGGFIEYRREEDQFYVSTSSDTLLSHACVPRIRITHSQAGGCLEALRPSLDIESAENEPVLLEIGPLVPKLAGLVEQCMRLSRVSQTLELPASLTRDPGISSTLEPDECTRELHYSPARDLFLPITTKMSGETMEGQIMMLSRDEAKKCIPDHPIRFDQDPETCRTQLETAVRSSKPGMTLP